MTPNLHTLLHKYFHLHHPFPRCNLFIKRRYHGGSSTNCKHPITSEWYSEERHEEAMVKQQRSSRVSEALKVCEAPELASYDYVYLTDPKNREEIMQNIVKRKGVGNIDKLYLLWEQIHNPDVVEVGSYFSDRDFDVSQFTKQLHAEAANLPNRTHADTPIGNESKNRVIEECGEQREFDFKPCDVVNLGEHLKMLRVRHLGHVAGHRSYYFLDGFARLERSLIRYSLDILKKNGFHLMSVPDLIHPSVIDGCGFKSSGPHTQVYRLEPKKHGNVCLSGTGEMPLSAYFINSKLYEEELPRKVCTVSRCYRAETASVEKGIYRVHQFYKVEMFVLTASESGEESLRALRQLLALQKEIFSSLGLHFRVVDIASEELGAPAYKKYDMEAWMPADQFWGEISSASSCTDYQARRLSIQYMRGDGQLNFAHTVNGTACAVPRMIMAIAEQFQTKSKHIEIPSVLQPYMGGMTKLDQHSYNYVMRYAKLSKHRQQTYAKVT